MKNIQFFSASSSIICYQETLGAETYFSHISQACLLKISIHENKRRWKGGWGFRWRWDEGKKYEK